MKKIFIIGLFFLFLSKIALTSTHLPVYIEGKDYQVVIVNTSIPEFPKNTVNVTEFFSYGCPWCYQLEPQLQTWLKTKPAHVQFSRVPVIFEKNWEAYAKAYYVATALNIEKKMTPHLFQAIQTQNKTLGNHQAMQKFFIHQGIAKNIAESAFAASPTLDNDIQTGMQRMQAYQVYVVPSLVIDGKYKTDLSMAKTNKNLIDIVQFLIDKRKTEKNIS